MDVIKCDLVNTPSNFHGGKISQFLPLWLSLSTEKWFYFTLQGYIVNFTEIPVQLSRPRPLHFTTPHQLALDQSMQKFINQGVVERCSESIQGPCFYSNIFPVMKQDGSARIILDLSVLNKHVVYLHFKMDTLADVIEMIHPLCFFVTVDLKDAYFSVPVRPEERCWFRFIWKENHYQFTCLPQGFTSAPRTFTKLLKPLLAHLRSRGIVVACYIDDLIFMAPSCEILIVQVKYALSLIDGLGLTIHPDKSMLCPSQIVEYLGFILDSVNMTVTLAPDKQTKISNLGSELLNLERISIRLLSSFIGNVVAAAPGVPLAPLRYKRLELVRNRALLDARGNYDSLISLPPQARDAIDWWISNIHAMTKSMFPPPPTYELFCDASLMGWGAKLGQVTTGGHWAASEIAHINVLELKTVLLSLRSLFKEVKDSHVRLHIDNTTAVACINRCSSIKEPLLSVTEKIFEWACPRGVILSAVHIRGCENVDADRASRVTNVSAEWMLKPSIFDRLCKIFLTPSIDLFATRINSQLQAYVSWNPDPNAIHTDAFTMSWDKDIYYGFPPFSVIGRCLQKIQEDRGTVVMILPIWPTRVWFPRALQMLADMPRILPQDCLTLPQDPSRMHPLNPKLRLMGVTLSGKPSLVRTYRMKLRSSYLHPGGREPSNNIGVISSSGMDFVSAGQLVHFSHL